jgi:hypothetical protein
MTRQSARPSIATNLCEIDTVREAAPDSATVLSAAVEAPHDGERLPTWTLPVSGWVVGRESRGRHVRVSQRDASWDMPLHDRRPDVGDRHRDAEWARYSGFSGAVNTLRLPPRFELELTAELGDGTPAPLGTITGRRAQLESSYDPELRPLIVTTLGRTGSTWLIHLLAGHPAVTAYRPFSFEPRAVTYWIDVLTSLSEPASYTQQVEGEVRYPHPWWLGSGTRMTSEVLPDAELARWLGSEHITDLAAFAQQRLDAVYLRIGALADERPEFFAEKCLPESNVPQLVQELYPDGREIFLVRDFRDMLCSIRAFNEKRGSSAFGRDGSGGEEAYVLDVLAPSVKNLLHEWRQRADTAQLVRYEDLILNPAEALRGILEQAGLEASTERVDDMLARAALPIPGMDVHRTAGQGATESVGRWRRDLEPELQAVCEEAFAEALAEFGYGQAARAR